MAYGKVRVDQVQSSTRTVDVDSLATTAVATQSVAGLLSATDKTKLDGVATGAEVNVNADWSAGSGDAQILNKPTLGTAAAKNTGTASGNVVELDGSARLPAVDGSQLTGINAATDLTYTAATRVLASSTGTDATLTLVTSSDAGLAPASGGGTTNFLRADGTWAAAGSPPAGSNTQIQFNDSSAFGGDADLTWNKTTNVMTVTGDVNLSDGGSFTTTLQTITPTAARTISFPDATGTVALVGGSSGQLLWNNAGAVGGASTLTYDGSILTSSGRFINSYNATASSPAKAFTGTWFTGGTATTTKPQVLIEPTGATSTAWSTAGTALGVNASSGFAGNLLDLQVNGTSGFSVKNNSTFSGYPEIRIRNDIFIDSAYARMLFASNVEFGWVSTTTASTGAIDIVLRRDAAGILAQRNAANAQTFRLYNSYTDGSNYERHTNSWSGNVFNIANEAAGTGTLRSIAFSANAAASTPPVTFTGTWFTGGTATTTKPQVLIEPTGATSTAWSTAGTGLGVNASSGFAGNLLDLQVNGSSKIAFGPGAQANGGLISFGTGKLTSNSSGGVDLSWSDQYRIGANGTGTFISQAGVGTVYLYVDASNTLAQRNGTNAQTFRCYGTFTDASNYVRAALSSTSTAVTLAAETAGTGADNIPLNLTAAGTGTVKVNSVAEVVVSSTVAGLPAAPVVGMLTRVTDALAPAVGTTVAGGGAAAALCWYNGASWSVIGV